MSNVGTISIVSYKNNQPDATTQVNLLFLVGFTCFGRCFRPSLGTLDCIYSIFYFVFIIPNCPKTGYEMEPTRQKETRYT